MFQYQELVLAALPILKAQTCLHEFVKQAWPVIEPKDEFVDGPHIKAICEHLQAVSYGVIKRLIINIPPRCGKSSLLICWAAWDWLSNPWRRFISASHGHGLTIEHSNKFRNLIMSDWYQKNWGHLFFIDKNTEKHFENNFKGYRKSTSVNSALAGSGAHIIVCDDLNDTKKVHSDTIRDSTNRWFSGTLCMRLNDRKTGAIVVVMQRSHELDVTGYILKDAIKKEWVTLILPMEFEVSRKCVTVPLKKGEKAWEDKRTKQGELLWPQKIGPDELQGLKADLRTDYEISGQLQQRPSPEHGGIIKDSYFKWWKKPQPPKLLQIIQSWDTALSEDDLRKNAYSACTTWGIFDDFGDDEINVSGIPNVILLDCWRGKLEYPELRKLVQRLTTDYRDKGDMVIKPDGHHKPDYILIEDKSSGSTLIQDLRRAGVLAVPFIPNKFGDKVERVKLCTHIMECGKVWLPASPYTGYKSLLPFAERFKEQCLAFPNAESRDLVDTLSQFLLRLTISGYLYNSNDPKRFSNTVRPKKYYSVDD